MYRRTCSELSPISLANVSLYVTPIKFCSTGAEFIDGHPACRFMASRRILYEKAFSLGRNVNQLTLQR